MKQLISVLALAVATAGACASAKLDQHPAPTSQPHNRKTMNLGAFSVSLAVKDLTASRAFYEKLGFEAMGGEAAQGWLILANGETVIGLFQGMFERNLLTFNPGWTQQAKAVDGFTDVRELQRVLKERGLELQTQADPSSTGPASLTLVDPDGNPVLIDQHVAAPGS